MTDKRGPSYRLILPMVCVMGLPVAAQANAFQVDVVNDAVDANPGDGLCLTAGQACSLRAAVQEANALGGEHSITLPAGTYVVAGAAGDDTAAEGDLDISSVITIVGAGADTSIIQGEGADRLFHVLTGAALTLDKVALQNGYSQNANGGAILNYGSLELVDASVSASSTLSDGGGIYDAGTALTLTRATFDGNLGGVFGGAVYTASPTLKVTDSDFLNNSADDGAAIYSLVDTDVTVTGGTFTGNAADTQGGALAIYGSAVVRNSLFSFNQAGYDGTTVPNGGAIYVGGNGSLSLEDTILTQNKAYGNGARGGALFAGAGSSVTLNRSEMANNSAAEISTSITTAGGGIYFEGASLTGTNCTLSGNVAPQGQGGGIYFAEGTGSLLNCTIAGNDGDNIRTSTLSSVSAANTLFAEPGTGVNCSGTLNSTGYNMDDDGTCGLTDPNDQPNTLEPILAALDTASTYTHALVTGSPARDTGDNTRCPQVDGRYFRREDGYCDIGAFEAGSVAVTPGVLGFELASAQYDEAAGTATFTVTRTDGSDFAVSVAYSTVDGTAIGGEDFLPAQGTLQWADHDTNPKTFSVQIVDDSVDEPDENFQVQIAEPTGSAALGAITSVQVSLIDNDEPPADGGGTTDPVDNTTDPTTTNPALDNSQGLENGQGIEHGNGHGPGGIGGFGPLFFVSFLLMVGLFRRK